MFNNEFRPMKRAHSPDFDNAYRGPPNFRGHQYNKRHRGEPFQPLTLEEEIARLGDTGSRNAAIGAIAKEIDVDLANKAGDEEAVKAINSYICKAVVSFPTRVATYATLIGLISVKHYNVSCQIINTLHASYPVYLEAQKWQEAITIMHLLSSLVNCKVIRPSALLSQFELLLEITLEDNIPQARSDYYVYTVLSSLPFVAQELSIQTEQHSFEQILNTIETYLSKRTKDHLGVTRVWLSSDSTFQMDYLDSLWVQTKNFRANNWNETFLHRPYNDKEYKDIMASSLIPQNSPTIQIPAHSSTYVYPSPSIVFRIFEDDVAEGNRSIPGSDKIERFCIENHIKNMIDELPNDPRDCARHLSNMYRSDHLPLKHILIETIIGELFKLPKPKHQPMLYHSLLYEFTKILNPFKNPDDMKFNYDFILNEAVKVLYDNLDTMNITCLTRFIDWFTFHLNNTEFLFPWQSWSDSTFKDASSPKAIFVQTILDHCIRFSFHKKISVLVSANLASLVPPESSIKYKPINAGDPRADELAAVIKKLIVDKEGGQVISETLNIPIDGVKMPEGHVFKDEPLSEKLLKIDIFTATVLTIASKSLTHLSSAIGKFKNVFMALTRIEGGQQQLLHTIHSCLETHSQLQVILVDKLLKAELVEAKEVSKWIFSERMQPSNLKCFPWEILNSTIRRVMIYRDNLITKRAKKQEEVKKPEKDAEGDDVVMDQEDKPDLGDEIEKASSNFNELLLQVFGLFAEKLGAHIERCETSSKSFMDDWYRWMIGQMQRVFFNYYDSLLPIYDDIKDIVDKTPSIGGTILNLNQQ